MLKKTIILLMLGLLLISVGCKAPPAERPDSSEGLPIFAAQDAFGNTVSQENWANYDLIMLNFWATWCPPCIRELPELQLLHEAYGERGLLLLGVLTDGKTEDALPLIEQFGLSYSIFTAEGDLKQFSRSVQAVPTSFFLSPSGEELMKVVGSRDYKGWAEIVEDLLP